MRESYLVVEIIETGQRGILVQMGAHYSLIKVNQEDGFEWDLLVENDEYEVLTAIEFDHEELE